MSKCKICKAKTKQIIDLGKMPIANAFVKNRSDDEFFYNLSVGFCPQCYMLQLDETVEPKMMFNENYQFISSTSQRMVDHFKKTAKEIMEKISTKKNPFVVEIGSNDGIMLKHIAKRGIMHLAIEPAGNVADLSRFNKVKVLEEFFDETSAIQILKKYGPADVIYGANTITHIRDLNSVFKGINILLKNDGLLLIEDPYLVDIIEKCSFDQIYDEHVYFFSGLSISQLAKRHNMQLINMSHQDVHGGSMRYYLKKLKKGKLYRVNPKVKKYLSHEKQLSLHKLKGYSEFKKKARKICQNLKKLLLRIKKQGQQIVAYGATAKSNTLFNYAQIGPDIVDYISDITPSKIGKYSPGMHIPIKSHDVFIKDKPPYTLLLAWNHQKEIFIKEKRYRRQGGKFITYFPKVKIE